MYELAELRAVPCRSLTGARIETRGNSEIFGDVSVAPSRGRGLKQRGQLDDLPPEESLPHGGAD